MKSRKRTWVLALTSIASLIRFGGPPPVRGRPGLFTASSAACALAPDVGWLIAARAVGGMVLQAIALALPGRTSTSVLRQRSA